MTLQNAFGDIALDATVASLLAKTPPEVGTWAYLAGASGTVNVPALGRVIGIAAHATTAGSFTINGGDSIPIPANTAVAIEPRGNLVAPTVVLTGTDLYFVEYVT